MFFVLCDLYRADIINLQIIIFVNNHCRKEESGMNKGEKPVKELLLEQSEELKTYIDRKVSEIEEILAESEGRLAEQLREKGCEKAE